MSRHGCQAGSPLTLPQSEMSVGPQPGLVLLHEVSLINYVLAPCRNTIFISVNNHISTTAM